MMDIVERLRHKSKHSNPNGLEIYEEAADELEHLHAELAASSAREQQYKTKLSYYFTANDTELFEATIGPQDWSALRERLAAERKRCADVCAEHAKAVWDHESGALACMEKINTLGDEL